MRDEDSARLKPGRSFGSPTDVSTPASNAEQPNPLSPWERVGVRANATTRQLRIRTHSPHPICSADRPLPRGEVVVVVCRKKERPNVSQKKIDRRFVRVF